MEAHNGRDMFTFTVGSNNKLRWKVPRSWEDQPVYDKEFQSMSQNSSIPYCCCHYQFDTLLLPVNCIFYSGITYR